MRTTRCLLLQVFDDWERISISLILARFEELIVNMMERMGRMRVCGGDHSYNISRRAMMPPQRLMACLAPSDDQLPCYTGGLGIGPGKPKRKFNLRSSSNRQALDRTYSHYSPLQTRLLNTTSRPSEIDAPVALLQLGIHHRSMSKQNPASKEPVSKLLGQPALITPPQSPHD